MTPEVATAAEAEAPWPLHGVILRSTLLRMLAHQLGLTPGDASADGSAAGLQHAAAYTEVGVSGLHGDMIKEYSHVSQSNSVTYLSVNSSPRPV